MGPKLGGPLRPECLLHLPGSWGTGRWSFPSTLRVTVTQPFRPPVPSARHEHADLGWTTMGGWQRDRETCCISSIQTLHREGWEQNRPDRVSLTGLLGARLLLAAFCPAVVTWTRTLRSRSSFQRRSPCSLAEHGVQKAVVHSVSPDLLGAPSGGRWGLGPVLLPLWSRGPS